MIIIFGKMVCLCCLMLDGLLLFGIIEICDLVGILVFIINVIVFF